MNMYVYGSNDWYFSIWQSSMPLEFHLQLSNWVGPIRVFICICPDNVSGILVTMWRHFCNFIASDSYCISLNFVILKKGVYPLDLLSYSTASGIPVALTIVKCWNINHQNHKHTYSHEAHDQNDKFARFYTLYDYDDWYFSAGGPWLCTNFGPEKNSCKPNSC